MHRPQNVSLGADKPWRIFTCVAKPLTSENFFLRLKGPKRHSYYSKKQNYLHWNVKLSLHEIRNRHYFSPTPSPWKIPPNPYQTSTIQTWRIKTREVKAEQRTLNWRTLKDRKIFTVWRKNREIDSTKLLLYWKNNSRYIWSKLFLRKKL